MFGLGRREANSVVSLLAAQIRRDISFGILQPDTKLKIVELRGKYGGSSNSFREALTQLTVEGLVEATSQKGFRVASATQADLDDIINTQCEIGCLILLNAEPSNDIAWEGQLVAAHHAFQKFHSLVELDCHTHALEWDVSYCAFLNTLMRVGSSSRLLEFHGRLLGQGRRFRLVQLAENEIQFNKMGVEVANLMKLVIENDFNCAAITYKTHIQSISPISEN